MNIIVDTGCANISSLKFAVERLTLDVTVSDDPAVIRSAQRVFLPGVGSAGFAMEAMRQKELVSVIQGLTQPVLGICLGMQLLFSSSAEGDTPCLGVIPGEVSLMDSNTQRLPHMGWNTLVGIQDHPLVKGISEDDYLYFVHSYSVKQNASTIAGCEYGQQFSAAVAHNNFMGVQFHPERSSKVGAQVLKNFLEINL